MVLAGYVVDDLETVVRHISLELGRGSPGVGSGVGDALDDGVERNDVGGRTTEEDQGDGVGRGRVPGDLESLASRNDLGKLACCSCSSRSRCRSLATEWRIPSP